MFFGKEGISIYRPTSCAISTSVYFDLPAHLIVFQDSTVSTINPTERLEGLAQHLIHLFSLAGQTVLNLGTGSGVFLLATLTLSHYVICIENDDF